MKLARQLASTGAGDLLVVDEPTTGLHPADLDRLLHVLRATADGGATVIVVEHHPDVVAAADWVVRLGPEGGPRGGELLEHGPPRARRLPPVRPRAKPRKKPRAGAAIEIRRAAAHNLQDVSLDHPQGRDHGLRRRLRIGEVVARRRRDPGRGVPAAARMPVPVRAPVGQGGPGGAGRLARGARADGLRHAGPTARPARDGRNGERDQLPPRRSARAARRARLRRVRSASAPPADAGGNGVDVSCLRCRGRPRRAAPLPARPPTRPRASPAAASGRSRRRRRSG